MSDIHQVLEAVRQWNERSVLVTVIDVEGSAYRKEGAVMLKEDGTAAGPFQPKLLFRTDGAERR